MGDKPKLTPAQCHRIARAIEDGGDRQEIANAWEVSLSTIGRIYKQYRSSVPVALGQARTRVMLDEWKEECKRWALEDHAKDHQQAPTIIQLRPRLPESFGLGGKKRRTS